MLPVRWDAAHEEFLAQHGRRRRVFCASLADVFDNRVDTIWRAHLWDLVRSTPHLDWLILTKRIGNAVGMLPADWGDGYPNVWLGASMVNQTEFDRDIGKLVAVPARIRFISFEPLLEVVDTNGDLGGIHWAIAGGESGPHARRPPDGAVDALHAQCDSAGVPFFFKQWGGTAKDKGGCILAGNEVKAWPIAA